MNVALRPAIADRTGLDILSICTGGGGLDLGVELAIPGARTVCMVEREAFAVAHLVSAMEQGLLAPAPVWSDARTFDGLPWRGCVDGLIGGIPCQPHSLAGRKRGSHDPRDLWSPARRIIVQSRAWFVLIENVRGMLAPGDDEIAGAERVWRDLRKLGFAVEGGLFTAAEVGASHERERIFIFGVADDAIGQRCGEPPSGRRDGNTRETGGCRGELADTHGERRKRQRPDADAVGREDARRQAGLCGRADLVDPALVGRGEGRAEPSIRGGRGSAAGAGGAMDNALGRRRPAGRNDHGSDVGYEPGAAGKHALVHAQRAERRADPGGGNQRDRHDKGWGQTAGWLGESGQLFPPGPSDLSRWRDALASAPELEPSFRRVADGLAARLDAGRVDRLRLLGNGVVPLAAAYAIRTLGTRLAGRGSAGAARLVRMMEAAE